MMIRRKGQTGELVETDLLPHAPHMRVHLPPSTSNRVLKPLHRPSTMATPLHVHPHFAPEEAAAVAAEFVSSELWATDLANSQVLTTCPARSPSF